MTYLYQWAHPDRLHGMAHPEDLEREGFVAVGRDPRYPSVLYRAVVEEQDRDHVTGVVTYGLGGG